MTIIIQIFTPIVGFVEDGINEYNDFFITA